MTQRRANERQGEAADEIVAKELGGEHVPGEAEWYDVVLPSGTKVEVKSTHIRLKDGSEGRFRLWEDQHRSLLSADSSGTAWYAFVLFGQDDELLSIQRRRPSTVTGAIDDVGEGDPWNLARHCERQSRQKKLPWSEVMDA